MLSFELTDTQGKTHLLTRPLKLSIRMDEDVPADDCCAVFAYEDVGETVDVRVLDGDRVIFVGVADEQEHIFGEQGRFLKISARSLAARLLDNEAMPECYDHPSAALIFERHVQRYGIVRGENDDAVYYGEQQVNKGMSQWAVLKNFCTACYSSTPRVTADGVLWMKGIRSSGEAVFSDTGDGIVYTHLSETIKRCEELSRVNVKINDEDGYVYRIDNDDAVRRGICRERYVNAVLSSTPMTCVDTMIKNGADASFSIRLKCPGFLAQVMGSDAVVKNRRLGTIGGLYVSGVSYRLDSSGGTSTLILKRRNNGCGYRDM